MFYSFYEVLIYSYCYISSQHINTILNTCMFIFRCYFSRATYYDVSIYNYISKFELKLVSHNSLLNNNNSTIPYQIKCLSIEIHDIYNHLHDKLK